ncbi:MAG: hypothetical protein ACRERC_08490 [Candidatus Binatia bacterium]
MFDDLLDPAVAEAMRLEFAALPDRWTFLHHFNEHKRIFTDAARMGPASRAAFAALQSPAFLDALAALTGIDGCSPIRSSTAAACTRRGPAAFSTCTPTSFPTPGSATGAASSI